MSGLFTQPMLLFPRDKLCPTLFLLNINHLRSQTFNYPEHSYNGTFHDNFQLSKPPNKRFQNAPFLVMKKYFIGDNFSMGTPLMYTFKLLTNSFLEYNVFGFVNRLQKEKVINSTCICFVCLFGHNFLANVSI